MSTIKKNTKWLISMTLNIFICWSLCLLPITTTYADEVLDGSGSNTSTNDTTQTLNKLEKSEEGNGVMKVEGSQIKAAGKFLFSNIALFASGFFAPGLLKACSNKWSVRVFAGSAALYVLNEIGLFTGFNEAINKEMVAYLNRGDEDKQIDSLETAAKQTRKAKDAAKRRAMIAKIAAAGYGVATALAAYEAYQQSTGTGTPCTGIAYSPAMPIEGTYVYQPGQNNVERMLTNSELVTLIPTERELYQVQRIKKFETILTILTKKFPLLTSVQAAEKVGDENDAKVYKDKDSGENRIIVNSVGAKLAATGLGAAAGLLIMNKMATFSEGIQNFIQNPYSRAVGFGVFSGVAIGASKESSDAAQKLEQRAQEYDRLADSLRNRVNQDVGIQTGGSQYIDQTVQSLDDGPGGSGIGNNELCMTGSSGNPQVGNCSCSATNTCATPPIPDTKGLPSFAGTPLLADSINSLKATGADIFAGRLKEAKTSGQALTNNAAKITRLSDAIKKKINEDRLKNGGSALDFEKAENSFQRKLNNDIEKTFNNLSPKEQQTLANLAGGGYLNVDGKGNEEEKDELAEKSGVATKAVAKGDVNPNPGKNMNKSADGAVWDFNFEEEAAVAAAEQAAIDAALKVNEDEDYLVDGDINDDRNKNLFNIITRRYLKSAYPVIFEEQ